MEFLELPNKRILELQELYILEVNSMEIMEQEEDTQSNYKMEQKVLVRF